MKQKIKNLRREITQSKLNIDQIQEVLINERNEFEIEKQELINKRNMYKQKLRTEEFKKKESIVYIQNNTSVLCAFFMMIVTYIYSYIICNSIIPNSDTVNFITINIIGIQILYMCVYYNYVKL